MTDKPGDALLAETFGLAALAYLCGVQVQDIDRRFRDDVRLGDAAETVLDLLLPLAERVASERVEHPQMPAFALDVLGTVMPGQEHSFGTVLRMSTGAGIDEPSSRVSADELVDLLCHIARDVYPQLLSAASASPWFGPRISLYQHRLRPTIQSVIGADPVLSTIFPDEDPGLGRSGFIVSSLGSGGTIQDVMFPETMLVSAWDRASLRVLVPTLAELYEELERGVEAVRRGFSAKAGNVPMLVAFTGFTTGGRSVGTPWGALRPLSEAERSASPRTLDGAIGGTDAKGQQVTVAYAGEVVLSTEVPFRLAAASWDPNDQDLYARLLKRVGASDVARHRIEGIQMAVLLGVDRPLGQWATAHLTWQWVGDPTSQGRSLSWRDPRSSIGFMPTELSEEECVAVAAWCRAIDTHRSKSIDIAFRRVLSAAQVRTDAADRLVDAVIAWENLFGTSEGEPRLRVSAAMAWLLCSSGSERRTLQIEIKKLYDDRSKIVHGATFDEEAVASRANRALELARSCLRILFTDRTDILALPDGSARSLNLILGS